MTCRDISLILDAVADASGGSAETLRAAAESARMAEDVLTHLAWVLRQGHPRNPGDERAEAWLRALGYNA
jgi:hypothetical protein